MANTLDLKLVLKHLSSGTLGENLCINCLKPLLEQYENIFTKVCKYDKEYCIADVLRIMCDVELSETDNYNVCVNCFMMASMAYKFYLLSKRSHEILNFYANELLSNMDQIQLPEETTNNTLCISLPEIETETPIYDFNLHAISKEIKSDKVEHVKIRKEVVEKEEDEKVVVIIQDNGKPSFYRVKPDGVLTALGNYEAKKYTKTFNASMVVQVQPKEDRPKRGRKRGPMTLKLCTRCPVKYRFIAKLKEHMRLEHNVVLYVCEVCKALTEDEQEYHSHLKTHTNIHQCAICGMVFKKRSTIIKHLKRHERMKHIAHSDNAHVCEQCGKILEDEESLRLHNDSKHYKKYTCYYCGRMYKGEMSFEMHIKKHEDNMETGTYRQNIYKKKDATQTEKAKPVIKRCMCSTCGRNFVDERALLWHQRLHNDERPYTCNECGRSFVSLNRRNQHALCAHTAPTRRCPLCPALFHLRSMVNTHVKKVHLKQHKRRNRISKHQNVFWRTETVPIQELSVEIQNDILALQAANKEQDWSDNAHVCEQCGKILEDEESLRLHNDSKHYKKYTCYYCGRMYKGEMSFEMHIKKHEDNMETGTYRQNIYKKKDATQTEKAKPVIKRCMCSTCGRNFVDERALLWHQRLHNDERPYTCNECGRSFVSLNRRNQHALCAHTAPTRRCPLCPALFHLRSMVNTHVKKVHLKQHKRRNRISKHQNVFWRTETVPIQELSVEIQNDILALQAANKEQDWVCVKDTPVEMEGI